MSSSSFCPRQACRLVSIVLLAACLPLTAWAGELGGTVTDLGGSPLPGATVLVQGTSLFAVTEADGKYAFASVDAGDYVVDVTMNGFRSDSKPAQVSADGAAMVDFTLELDVLNFDTVVVTANVNQASKLESSISVSTVDAETIQESAPRSTAEIFRNVPGIRSESTGGEGNANIAVRGLPVAAGGAKFLQLQEDGLPVMEFGDIAFGNADIFLRHDLSIERIEAVRGGSASTLASNSPGGVINFVSRTGTTPGGRVGITSGLDYDSTRFEFAYGGSAGENWSYHVAGFYRSGEGVREAGYTAEDGGQLKANITRYFENGYARFYVKVLDDRAIGYLPMPVRVTGTNSSPSLGGFSTFDPGTDTPHSVYFLRDVGLDGNNNYRVTDITDGMRPKTTAIGAEFSFDLKGGWTLTDRFRVADNSGRFVSPFPAEVTDAASVAASIGGAGSSLIYANGVSAGAGYGGTVIRTHVFNTEINDFGNVANDLQLTKSFDVGDDAQVHLKLGYYKSRQTINMDWVWNSYLMELQGDNAALLDVVAADGSLRSVNGLYAYGVPFWGNCCQRSYDTEYDIDAPYVSLAYDSGKLSLDASVRFDSGDAFGTYAGTLQVSDFDVDGDGVISAVEESVSLIDNGRAAPVNYDWSYTSYSVGANYLFNDDFAGFARLSSGGRANADRLLFGLVGPDGSVREEDAVDEVDQFELGIKWRSDNMSLFVTLFQAETEEQNFEATSQRFLDRVYEAQGIEIEAAYQRGAFNIRGGVTFTDAEIASDEISPANVGNTPRRQADMVFQLTPEFRHSKFGLGLNIVGTTDSYAQDNNQLKMPGFEQVNLFADVALTGSLTLLANVNNLFDEFGITESEEGAIIDNQVNIIRARSIPGRSAGVSLRYQF